MCDLKQLDFPEDFQTYYVLKKTFLEPEEQ